MTTLEVLAVLIVAALAGLLYWWRRRAEVRARELERGLRGLVEGRAVWPIASRAGPLRGLAKAFNRLAPLLESRIADLEIDRQQLRAVLGSMIEGVIVVDAHRRLRFANESAQRLFGLDASAVGRLLPEVIRTPAIREAMDATLAGAGPYQGEVVLPGLESSSWIGAKTLAVHGTPMPGPPPEAVLVFHDVTELRRLERMRQDFVANVSHELKTPLASIRAYTDTLLDWALSDATVNEKFLHQIDEQAERLDSLIRDLLSLARIESGQDVFDHRPLVLARLVTQRVESHRDRAAARSVDLRLESRLTDTDLVRADEEAVRQILDNLIDNAIKYTATSQGWVRVVGRSEGPWLALDVIDNGTGIPREEQNRIFERFYRVDKARSRELGGTGLGLSIVKHLVQAIDGTIEVHSRVGSGSRFIVRIPRLATTWDGGRAGRPASGDPGAMATGRVAENEAQPARVTPDFPDPESERRTG